MKTAIQYVQVGAKQVRYEVLGKQGEPIVLVHGLSGSTLWWRRNAPFLAERYRVYIVDLPGFGSMHFPRSRFVLKQAAAWLLQWMEAVKIGKAHLIGHSMGGYICLWLAAHYPDTVLSLVLVAPALFPRAQTVYRYFLPMLLGARYMSPSFFSTLFYDALRAGPLTLLQAARDLVAQDTRTEMKQIQAPTLLIWGEHDTLVPTMLAPVVREEIKGSHLYILKGAGHVCMFDRPTEFNRVVQKFLQGEEVGS